MSSLADKGLQISKNAIFSLFMSRAGKLLGKPFKVVLVLNEVADKLSSAESKDNKFKQLLDAGRSLVRLVQAYVNGSYRQIETGTIVSGLAVLLYTLSPIDLVPDFIPVLGFLDDLSLLSWFIGKFQSEIRRFREWEATGATATEAPAAGLPLEASATSAQNAAAVSELGHS
ncbi:YkvA family protein [Hymenobacter latericus]|uniref:YkvA family protein n=1 Tax=Hymenobacter sp. YIM 151858-1 TaxID=2987688 RepID=UPI0039B3E45C